ncbi:hypothetical protein EHS25_009247 [Saitozyma podzolica]|uniref:Uncharacterized protein n=1 Tax=Saitozyma podzolica TaxID=1890683 RepID=A0A427YLE8_9TREE|nr:hypothetical protein EHS25_009247 [Saitozyma podzolica]
MSLNHYLPKKISLKPKKHHGFTLVLFLLGLLLPPLAVAARFGIGKDFFINVILCICGYFPCHFHNFYIQNIRNNTNRARTPKWAIKAGLVDNSERDRKARKNQWAKRFDERNAQSTLVGQSLEEGEEGEDYNPVTEDPEAVERRRNEGLWNNDDEEYYDEDRAVNQKHWHYPANFEGAVGDGRSRARKDNATTGDRWERSRNSRSDTVSSDSSGYPPRAATDDDVPEWGRDYGSKKKNSKGDKGGRRSAKKGGSSAVNDWMQQGNYVQEDQGYGGGAGGGRENGRAGGASGANGGANANAGGNSGARSGGGNIFDHEF